MNKASIHTKVLLDIFAAPPVLFPIVGGLTLLLFSWAFDFGFLFSFAGIAGMLFGLGLMATRLIFGIETLTEDAFNYINEQKEQDFERELDRLDKDLASNRDSRDQGALRQLRLMYKNHKEQLEEKGLSSSELFGNLEDLFHGCIDQLKYSFDLWKASKGLRGPAKDEMQEKREVIIEEVLKSVEYFSNTIEEYQAMSLEQGKQNLAKLREEVGDSLEVTKQAEEKLANFEKTGRLYDESEFQ